MNVPNLIGLALHFFYQLKDEQITYRGFLPYATFGTWKKFALAKNRINKIFILCTQ